MRRIVNTAALSAATIALVLGVVGCSSPAPQPEAIATPTTEPSASAEPAPSETETEEAAAAVGTRENPVPVGQVLAFSADSAFKVGASGPTQVAADFSVLPLVIQIDWANFNAQSAAQGQPPGGPFQPWASFGVSFVTAGGTSYDTMDNYSVTIENQLFDIGDVYEGTDAVNANVPVSVPEAEIAGGVWVVENYSSGARVFIAPQ
ncbi:hypothetical protein HDC37_003348 [Microbacterium sp. AK009]|uniref:hypothetical protein n=1 Tax=Microbacterium sp. AK009 TaxID=2723068 RepID=UPI0015C6ED3E|nr:hypothetical protein [Microbacterium sp. AK009]NYF18484.1 hypothetical protein [Microbacterium sp. AK009]